jgi:hypothetical protein
VTAAISAASDQHVLTGIKKMLAVNFLSTSHSFAARQMATASRLRARQEPRTISVAMDFCSAGQLCVFRTLSICCGQRLLAAYRTGTGAGTSYILPRHRGIYSLWACEYW